MSSDVRHVLRSVGYNYVLRPVREKLNQKYTQKIVKHPPSAMVWEAITAKGCTGHTFIDIDERMNAQKYIDVLKESQDSHGSVWNYQPYFNKT